MKKSNFLYITSAFLLLSTAGFAQVDTVKEKTVDITSAFKPVLRESAKINFDATPPAPDNTVPNLTYNIPNQNLALAFQPGSLRPLAMDIDSTSKWINSNYIKVGFGNFSTPLVEAGVSFGDGSKSNVGIYANHISSKGKIDFQDYARFQVGAKGFTKTANDHVISAGVNFKQDKNYKYGFADTLIFPKDSLLQRFNTLSIRLGLNNNTKTEYGLLYAPEIKVDFFSDNHKNNETNAVIDLPLKKSINEKFNANLGLTFDLTRTALNNTDAISNNAFWISPTVQYKDGSMNIYAGVRPSWNNGEFKMFPNVMLELSTSDQRFALQAGWSGIVRKTNYQYLANFNPFVRAPEEFNNSIVIERYAGFKGGIGDHIYYGAKLGFNKITNQALFVNDTSAADGGKTFEVLFEPDINVINVSAQVGYTMQEKFSVMGTLNLNKYTGIEVYDKPYGLVPLDLLVNFRTMIAKDLWLKSDLYAFAGTKYRKNNAIDYATQAGGIDLNAGLEFKALKNLNIWLQMNNITNNKYERWKQYKVYGFNFVAGIVYSFDQKN